MKVKLGSCARIGRVSSTTMGPQDTRLTVHSNPEKPARQRSDDTRAQRSDAHDAFALESTDDMETAALIGDGHAFGKMRGACHVCV